MRHKETVDLTLTDRQLFARMKIGDPWIDANMHHVFKYLYHCPKVRIPDSWLPEMRRFDAELTSLAPFLDLFKKVKTVA